jgi:hypothetical protein
MYIKGQTENSVINTNDDGYQRILHERGLQKRFENMQREIDELKKQVKQLFEINGKVTS